MEKTGPQHGIIGDENFGTDLPETQVPERDLTSEKNAAKFSRTKEFQVLKEHLESRIEYYQKYLPNGRPLEEDAPSPEDWRVANRIIGEFNAVITAYEQAAEVVKNESRL